MGSNENKGKTRKVLSLKSTAGVQPVSSSYGSRTVDVEVRKKRSGLVIDITKSSKNTRTISLKKEDEYQNGKLTDKEFKARVKALQEAIKEEQEELEQLEEQHLQDNFASYTQEEPVSETQKSEPAVTPKDDTDVETQNSKKIEAQKKDKYEPASNPVVFKAKEYTKPKPSPKKQNTEKKQEPTAKKETQPKQLEREIPDIPLKEHTATPHIRQRDRMLDDMDSPKKLKLVVKTKNSDRRSQNSGKISRAMIDRIMDDDLEERSRSMASIKRARQKLKGTDKPKEVTKVIREVEIPDMITVGELANRMAVRSAEVVKYLMSIGTMATINQSIDGDTAEVICSEFGHKSKRISDADIENELLNVKDDPADLSSRAPIVAVMGHVDHGKTTLLDTLRKTSVAQREAGGITQHVAAYQIDAGNGKKVTFIDTPGHAAFTKIRERGAVITDIIVLVVAADDGIKEQTIEVIKQAKSQNVPLVVAINKIDKPDVNIEKVKTELMAQEVILEEFGGDTLSAEISAKQNLNLDKLLEAILLQAEILDLKANANRAPIGTILESRIDKGKGVIASVIIQHGTIRKGDVFVAGGVFGKVRTMYDDTGKISAFATPSTPVEIAGFDSAPEPGDVLAVVDSEQKAREIAEYRRNAQKAKASKDKIKSMDQLLSGNNKEVKELNVLVKADVYGSLEAVVASLEAIQHPEISLKIVEKGVGIISESDIDFAKTANAVVVGFNVNTSVAAKEASKFYGIKILNHNVIYHMTEEIKKIMGTMLAPIIEENYTGNADVRKIFTISRLGTIAGCYVTDGIIKKANSKIKVLRNGKCIFEGKIKSMKHEKDEIKESRQSHECGILAEDYNDFKEGDQIECYEIVYKSRSVD